MLNTDKENQKTDALKLVWIDTVYSFWRSAQTISSEDGFGLELFRGGIHLGSILSSQVSLHPQMKQRFQELNARKGDTCYRVNLGPRIQFIQGTLQTMDGYNREYSVIIELQVIDPLQFITLYRQGADPVNLVILNIESIIQEYAERTNHDQMIPTNIQSKAELAFASKPDCCIAGIQINRAYQPSLRGDPLIQEQVNLEREIAAQINKLRKEAKLVDAENQIDFESAKQIQDQELVLLRMRQEKDKAKSIYEIEKDSLEEAHRLRKSLSQWAYSQWIERAGEALQANEPVQNIVEEMSTLSHALESGLPQISEPPVVNKQLLGERAAGAPNQPQNDDSQIVEVPSSPKRNIKKLVWGLTLVEIRVSPDIRGLLDEQERAFQVIDVLEGQISLSRSTGGMSTPTIPLMQRSILSNLVNK